MANIGMKHPVYAAISEEAMGSAITYGTGSVLAHAIAATVNLSKSDSSLYGDDIEIESDNGITDYTIDLEVDDIPLAARAGLLGYKAVNGSGSVEHYAITGEAAPYVGFGYVKVLLVGGVKKFEGYWFHKVRFSQNSEVANSKKEQIEWGTSSLTGNGCGVVLDDTGVAQFYDMMRFESEAAAVAWVNNRANIA